MRVVKRFLLTLLAGILFLAGVLEYSSYWNNAQAAVSNPQLHGTIPGYLDRYKRVIGSSKQFFDMLENVDRREEMDVTIAEVKVTGTTSGSGQVLNYSKNSTSSNNGYAVVNINEARSWASTFNGNPSFISSANGLYGFAVKDKIDNTLYTGYLLAEVAEMSGGRGLPQTFTSVSTNNPDEKYKGVVNFETSPRPKGGIGIGSKSQYNVGDTVYVNFWAEDYSFYNRGIKVLNYYIYNRDTGKTEYSFSNEIRTHSAMQNGDSSVGGPGSPYHIEKSGQKFVPTKAGNYEARVLITDLHDRNSQNTPAVGGAGVAYSVPFKVGNPGPTDPTDPTPGPSCSVGSTKTRMDIQVEGDKDVKNHNSIPSGGSDIAVEKNATITLYASKPGTFKMNNDTMEPGSGGNKKVGTGSIGSSGRVKVVYISDDGSECWEKYFRVESPDGEDSCPIVTLSASGVSNGKTIEIMQFDKLTFKAKYTTKYGDSSDASLKWDVILPNGKIYTLPVQESDKGRWGPYNSSSLKLPYGTTHEPYNVQFERGKTYKLKLNFDGTKWEDRPECNWEITIVVKDASCSIADQKKVRFLVHGEPPLPFSPEGEAMNGSASSGYTLTDPVYIKYFTEAGDQYDTNMSFSSQVSGTWYLKDPGGEKTALTDKLAANEQFRLMLPSSVDVGDEIVLLFESETGCTGEVRFTIETDRKCWDIMVSVEYRWIDNKKEVLWKKDIKRGETIEMAADEIPDKYTFRMFFSDDSHYSMRWYDPATGKWERKRNGESLSGSNKSNNSHWVLFPENDNNIMLEGLYKVQFYSTQSDGCDGHFFVQIGDAPKGGENLLIQKSSFEITPKAPQAAGTNATITFNVKNEGELEHDTKLAVRWASSPTATVLDVKSFKPGEVRKITVPTKYPEKSENFIANINPNKDKPSNETKWPDNRAEWPIKVAGGGDPPGGGETPSPGGPIDAGQLKIRVYDSGDRLLNLPNDGVWEKERARIEVEIDQTKINQALGQVNAAVNNAINEKRSELTDRYSGDNVKGVSVTASPTYWNAVGNPMTTWPSTTPMTVNGPGVNATYSLNTNQQTQSNFYTGTTVPTKKDKTDLLSTKYVVTAEGFQIVANYKVDFSVSFENCDEDGENCSTETDSDQISNTFTINIKGDKTQFEVFDLYVVGKVMHTDQWNTNRKLYNTKKSGNPEVPRYYDMYWAGERFMLRGDTPDTGASPVKLQSVKVTMSITNDSTFLNERVTSYTFTGSMWKNTYERLLNGPYTFTFLATWNHGHTETDTYTITIQDIWTNFYELHRLH